MKYGGEIAMTAVKDIMQTDVVAVSPDATVVALVDLLALQRHLPPPSDST